MRLRKGRCANLTAATQELNGPDILDCKKALDRALIYCAYLGVYE